MGRNDEKRRFHTEYIDDSLSDAFKTSKMSNMANISKKTAAIQCNLLKNIPKITLFTRKQSENKNKMNQSTINTTNFTYNKKTTNKNESS